METTPTQSKLELNTKGFCFLCLREQNDPLQDIKMEPDSLVRFSYQSLLQFLKMDRKKILDNLCAPAASLKVLEKAELVVQVCSQCNSTTQQFLVLHKKLEIIRKDLNSIVHKIHDVMANAEEDQIILEYFKEKMTCGNEGMLHSKLIHNLRRETMEKCSNKRSSPANPEPQVSMLQVSESDPSTSSSSVTKETLSERSPSPSVEAATKCSYCPAKFTCPDKSTEHWRLRVHLYVHHCEQLFEEYRNPSITPYHFKVCCALLFQNFSESEKGFHCPYCPYIQQKKPSGSVKSFVFLHVMDTHKDELILRLQDLQRKDQDELLQMHQDSGGKSCEHCGDMLYSASVLQNHIKYYCLKVKNTPNSKRPHIPCPYCPANIKNDRNTAFSNHLFTYHFDKHMADYKLPSVSTQHFKVCAGLVLQNVGVTVTETQLLCPYCPHARYKLSKMAKRVMFPHIVDNHKDKVIQRLQELQKLDMNTLMNSYGGNKGRACEACGDFFPTLISWRNHVTLYCHVTDKRKRTEVESGSSSHKKVKLNESPNSGPEAVVEPVRKTIIIIRASPTIPAPSRKKVICSICGEEYSDSASLQKHKSTHTPVSVKNLSFPCPHCPQVLDFYLTLRAHLLKCHPAIMFRTHLPPETSSEEIENALKYVISSLSRASQGEGESEFEAKVKHSCTLCSKEYVDFAEVESHILVTHFNKVKLRLGELIMKNRQENEGNIAVVKVEKLVENEENN